MRSLARLVLCAVPAWLAMQTVGLAVVDSGSRPWRRKRTRHSKEGKGLSNHQDNSSQSNISQVNSTQINGPQADNSARIPNVGVFIAGLEGTMHHFWHTVFDGCRKMGNCTFPNSDLQTALWNLRDNQSAISEAWGKQKMGNASMLYLNHAQDSQLSYPNWKGDMVPQLVNYAYAAASRGDRMKVVVMLRNADNIYKSDLYRWNRSVDHLVQAAHVMISQLKSFAMMFPDSWICVEQETLPAIAEKADAFFTRPETGEHVFNIKHAMEEIYNDTKVSTCKEDFCKQLRVRRAVQEIQNFCFENGKRFFRQKYSKVGQQIQAQHLFDFLF